MVLLLYIMKYKIHDLEAKENRGKDVCLMLMYK